MEVQGVWRARVCVCLLCYPFCQTTLNREVIEKHFSCTYVLVGSTAGGGKEALGIFSSHRLYLAAVSQDTLRG